MKPSRYVICLAGLFGLLMPLITARAATTDVDVMILYDRGARSWLVDNHGGSYLANANLVIGQLNQAIFNSGITNVNYRLAHFGVIEGDYSGPVYLTNMLQSVHDPSPTSAFLPIKPWREAVGADVVAVVLNSTDGDMQVGIGDIPMSTNGDPEQAFSVVMIPNTELDDTFTHNIGHSMGCGHSKFQGIPGWDLAGWPQGPGVYSNAAGWYFQGTNLQNYRTIMATDDDGAGYQSSLTDPRMFSTPNLRYKGIPIGDLEHGFNVSCIERMAPVVATNKELAVAIPPSVEITMPAFGAFIPAISGVSTFPVYAEALSPTGSIVSVEFRNLGGTENKNSSLYWSTSVSSSEIGNPDLYKCDMYEVTTGTNWLYAVATDDGGNCWTSALTCVYVELGSGPSVRLLYNPPTNSMAIQTRDGPGWVQHGWLAKNFTASAYDADGWVDHVTFYANDIPIGTAVNPTPVHSLSDIEFTIQWRFPFPPPAPGFVTNYITALAFDNDGVPSWPSTTNVVVMVPNIPPYAEISSPTNGATLSTNLITFVAAAHAYDIDDSITQMVFYVNGTAQGVFPEQVDSFTYLAPGYGSYTGRVAVWDEDGASIISPPTVVTVGPNNPPYVAITLPTNGTVLAGRMISIQADASDAEDWVQYVGFFANGTPIATITNAPYWTMWQSAGGVYSITAVAVDVHGAATTSTAVSVTAGSNLPPTLNITSPVNNAVVSDLAASVTVSCTASDVDGLVTSVVFYVDGVMVGVKTSAPYSIVIPNPGPGTHTTTVSAFDDSGNIQVASATWLVTMLPDLVVSRIIFKPVNVSTTSLFNVDVMIMNMGYDANNFHVSLWENSPSVPVDDSGETAGADIAVLAAGDSTTLSFTNLNPGTASVPRTLRVFVDSRFSVDEGNEANNQKKVVYTPSGAAVYEYVDLMMLYEESARTWIANNHGGSFLVNANLEIEELNQVMLNSTVPVRYRLVHFGVIGANYSGNLDDMVVPLYHATNDVGRQVDSWRMTCGADLAAVRVNGAPSDGYSSVSYMPRTSMGSYRAAFSVGLLGDSEITEMLATSVGMNMGCGNSKYQKDQPGPGVYSNAAGWYFQGTNRQNYCTLMAAEDDGYGINYRLTQPPIFSSPNLRYMGVPAGDVDNGDNVSCLNNMFPVIASYTQEPEDMPPSVEIVSPRNGETFASPKNRQFIPIKVEAMDPDGTVTSIVFYANGVAMSNTTSSVTNSPYVFTNNIPNLTRGSNQLCAVAWDNGGNCWTSAPVYVMVSSNVAPTVELVSPPDGTAQHGWLITNITATATDPDGTVTAVVFYTMEGWANGTPFATVTNRPFTASWLCPAVSTIGEVSNSILVQAWDDEGAFSPPSPPRSVVIGPDIPPFVEISSPTNGAHQWMTNVTITAGLNQYDIDDYITQVVFYVNGAFVDSDTTSPYSCTWTATGSGTNTAIAVVWAGDSQCSTSRPSTFIIGPSLPPNISITTPINGAILNGRGIYMVANATDPEDDALSPVRFQVDGVTVATVTPPYRATWLSPSSGVYSVRAIVSDATGLTTTSAVITVTSGNNLPPIVNITAPTNGAVIAFFTPKVVNLYATAVDPDGSVTSVEFYVNGAFISRSASGPFGASIDVDGAETNTTTVVAWDNSGNPWIQSATWYVRDMRQEFFITSLQLVPAMPAVGSNFSAIVTVTNAGETAANAGFLWAWTNAPAVPDLNRIPTLQVPVGILQPHTSRTLTCSNMPSGSTDATGLRFGVYVKSLAGFGSGEITYDNNYATVLYNVGDPFLRIIGLSGDLWFGNVVTGLTATSTMTITNTGYQALTVTGINYPAGFSGPWSGSLLAGAGQDVTVTFTPVDAISYGGYLTVNCNMTSGDNTHVIGGRGRPVGFPFSTGLPWLSLLLAE